MKQVICLLVIGSLAWFVQPMTVKVPELCEPGVCNCGPPNDLNGLMPTFMNHNGTECSCFCGKKAGEGCDKKGHCIKCYTCMADCDSTSDSLGICTENVNHYKCPGKYQTPVCNKGTDYEVTCINNKYHCSDKVIDSITGRNLKDEIRTFPNECKFYMENLELEIEEKFFRID